MEETVSIASTSTGRFGIGAKMAALVCAAVIGTAAAWVSWSYHRLADGLLAEEFGRQRVALTALASQLNNSVQGARRDVLFLTALPPIAGIMEARRAEPGQPAPRSELWWRERLAEIFTARLHVEPNFFRIRLIDAADGREIVRVDRHGDQLTQIPGAQLQERTDRPYFRGALSLPAEAVYFTDPEPNDEDWSGPLAGIPVMRASTPVYDTRGQIFAVMVIDKDMRSRLARLRETLAARYKLYVFNEAGRFLAYSDGGPADGARGTVPPTVEDKFPLLWPLDSDHETQQTIVNLPETGETVIAGSHKLFYDREHSERFVGLLTTLDYDTAIAPSIVLRNQAALFGSFLTVVTIATVLVFSRRLTRPLSQITDAVVHFTRGDFDFELPRDARDEAGVLARAFDDMFHRLRAHDAALRAEVAERRRAENALRGSEQRLQLALYAAAAGVWVWDADSGKTVWDRSMARLFGVQPGDFGGTLQSWSRFVHPDDWPAVEASLRRNASSEAAFSLELRAALPDRGWRHVKLRGTRGLDHQGPAVIGVCWDISEEKLAQERIKNYVVQLEQKNQEMEQFVYSVSHDLKAPLVTCKGFLGILREDLSEGKAEQATTSLQRLERAAQQMTRLIDDLLQFSRVGRAAAKPETIDVAALVRELAEEARRRYAAEDVCIDIEEEMPKIVADPTAVARVFQNLLGNALKYGRDDSEARVEVGSRVVAEEIRFFVRDNGAGIPEQYHQKVFGLFQRLDTKQEGTGLGLAIVSKIMSIFGGRVWVESSCGQGAAFWLAFPIRYAASETPVVTRSLA